MNGKMLAFSPGMIFVRGVSIEISGGGAGLARRYIIVFDVPPYLNGHKFMVLYWDAVNQIWVELTAVKAEGGKCILFVDFPGAFILVVK